MADNPITKAMDALGECAPWLREHVSEDVAKVFEEAEDAVYDSDGWNVIAEIEDLVKKDADPERILERVEDML